MRLGVFSVGDTYPGDAASAPDPWERLLALARTAERCGYDAFYVAEHHFQSGGVVPAPPVWLAAAARETRTIRLGPLVAVLPFHHPVELAEQYALVDRLSHGRLEIGVGSGYLDFEFHGLGLDPTSRHAELERRLPAFLAALGNDPVPPSPGAARPAAVNVPSLQRPHPPIWRAAARTEGIRAAARDGHGLALVPYATLPSIEGLRASIAEFSRALAPSTSPRVLAAMHVVIAEDSHEAELALTRFLDTRHPSADPAHRAFLTRNPALTTARGLIDRGLALVGDARTVERSLERLASDGVTDLAAIVDFGGLPTSSVLCTLERLPTLLPETGSPRPWLHALAPVGVAETD